MEFLDKPWPQLTAALRKAKKRIAVTPYLNGEAYDLLPLRTAKDMLVVDACERNVKLGLTNPHEILRFLKAGVRCYTVDDLHAKAYRADNTIFVGSNNASTHSRDTLLEACLQVRNSAVVQQFELWLNGLALVPLRKENIAELKRLYKPPHWTSAHPRKPRRASAYIMWVEWTDSSEETEEYKQEVSKEYDLDADDIYTIAVGKNNRIARAAKAGDEFFVLDHHSRHIKAYAPMRLIERPKLIGHRYRLALEDTDENPVSFKSFLRVARRTYPRFPESGRSQRGLTSQAAAELRKLWL